MKNRNVGFLIAGLSVVMLAIVILFNQGLKSIVSESCTHGSTCPMYGTIYFQTWLSLLIVGIIFLIGVFFIFSKESEKIILKTRTIKEKRKAINTTNLDKTEQEVVKILQNESGAIFQRTLMEKLNIGKVGVTRLLDKLESKQIIERKRRGMNNIVILK